MFETTHRGAKLAYDFSGRGPGVLLLHATACSSAAWRRLRMQLEPRFSVVAADLYGYGRSDAWPGQGPLSLQAEAEAALATAEVLERPFHLVGHSYGGAVALKLANMVPQAVKSLTLIEPVSFHLLRGESFRSTRHFQEIAAVSQCVSEAAASGDYDRGLAAFIDFWSEPGTWQAMAEEKREALRPLVGRIALNFWAGFSETLTLADCQHLRMPALVLEGEISPKVTRHLAELLGETLPNAERRVVDGAGHMLPLTHPETVNSVVGDFLAAIEAGKPRAMRRTAA